MKQAGAALARGNAKEAFRLASRSHRKKATDEAAALMGRAACRTGNKEAAKAALKLLPLGQRGSIRSDCRRNGTRIGL